MANYAQTVNVIGAIKTTATEAELEPTGLVLALYRRHFGTLPVVVREQPKPLDVAAAWTADRSALHRRGRQPDLAGRGRSSWTSPAAGSPGAAAASCSPARARSPTTPPAACAASPSRSRTPLACVEPIVAPPLSVTLLVVDSDEPPARPAAPAKPARR